MTTKTLGRKCAFKRKAHTEQECGELCECTCHKFTNCEGCEKEGHITNKKCLQNWEHIKEKKYEEIEIIINKNGEVRDSWYIKKVRIGIIEGLADTIEQWLERNANYKKL